MDKTYKYHSGSFHSDESRSKTSGNFDSTAHLLKFIYQTLCQIDGRPLTFKLIRLLSNDYKFEWLIKQPSCTQSGIVSINKDELLKFNLAKKILRILKEEEFAHKHHEQFKYLTNREKEVLAVLAQGQSNREIAKGLFISIETVKYHRKMIKSKLEASSTAYLIRYAHAFDLI